MKLLLRLINLGFPVFCTGLAAFDLMYGEYAMAIVTAALGLVWVLALTQARNAYRSGWWQGRMEMIDSMDEASERGLTFSQWVDSMVETDLAKITDRRWPTFRDRLG